MTKMNDSQIKPITLSQSEIIYVYTLWKKNYEKKGLDFLDFLQLAMKAKENTKSVYTNF